MTSPHASDALAVAQSWRPDALVLDIGMPDKDGYELLADLSKLLGDLHKIPAVALTGFASSEDRARAMRAGFHAHISKPFDMEALCILVLQLVQRARR